MNNRLYSWMILIFLFSCRAPRPVASYSGEITSAAQDSTIPAVIETVMTIQDSTNFKQSSTALYDSVQIRYAGYLKVGPELINNLQLYYFIERWMNTPYKWGGADERGIDCSAFVQKLLSEVYSVSVPRTSVEQFRERRITKLRPGQPLEEGDLVFFKTIRGKPISHVGLYLHNHMFINSSSSKGVSIASLKDPYWRSRYIGARRVR